jgi:hypothetical protein
MAPPSKQAQADSSTPQTAPANTNEQQSLLQYILANIPAMPDQSTIVNYSLSASAKSLAWLEEYGFADSFNSLKAVKDLVGKNVLMIHGLADQSVLPEHSVVCLPLTITWIDWLINCVEA